MEEISISIPQELADKVSQLAPASSGPIFGFRAQIITYLLAKWADEKEAELIRRQAGPQLDAYNPL